MFNVCDEHLSHLLCLMEIIIGDISLTLCIDSEIPIEQETVMQLLQSF